jgi:energy-coupling factor transport system ATP-binding protein
VIEAVRSALESIGLSELKNSPPLELSGGQMQLAAIAGVLAMQPDCIVFDEATSMLDMTTKAKVFNLIHNLHKEGKTILHITHNITEASHAERIILLGGGNIILDKGTAQFMEYASMKIPGFEAPPILELSIGLKKAGILQTYTVDMDKIVEEICHFRSEH